MYYLDLIAKASYQLWVVDPDTMRPCGFGSGCIVNYQERSFLLSVAHVTSEENKVTCIVTNQLPEKDLQSKLYIVDEQLYFDKYKLPEDIHEIKIKNFEELQAKSYCEERLDITCCEIKEKLECIQPELDLEGFKINRDSKVHLNLDSAGNPDKNKRYGFFGTIRHRIEGDALVKSVPTFKIDLQYKGSNEKFHLFRSPETIKDADDYLGCSGAPILEDTGKLVGLFSSFNLNSKTIFGFSILECKTLLDRSLESGVL